MTELKKLSPESVAAALDKVERYRLLNEPWEAESICRDVLAVEPDNQDALIQLLLAMTDQLRHSGGPKVREVRAILDRLEGEYRRCYYAGIIAERQAKGFLARGGPGTGPAAYETLREAMEWYEKAETLAPAGDDSALLRWNTCARLIDRYSHLRPAPETAPTLLE